MASTREVLGKLCAEAKVDESTIDLERFQYLPMRDLCKKVFCSNEITPDKEAELASVLIDDGCPDHLSAVDGSEEIPAQVLNHGINFFMKYAQDHHREDDLLIAAECGVFEAIAAEIRELVSIMKNPDVTENESDEAFGKLFPNLVRLGKLYWTPGYIYSCLVLLDLSNHFRDNAELTTVTLDLINGLRYQAIKFYLWAMELKDKPESLALYKIFYKENDSDYQWAMSKKGKEEVFAGIDSEHSDYFTCEAEQEMHDMLNEARMLNECRMAKK